MVALIHLPIPIPEAIAHLTKEQIEVLYDRYLNQKHKPKDLFVEYNIEGLKYQLFKLLIMPKENPDNSCTIHNVISWQKVETYRKWSIPYCPICKQFLYTELTDTYFISIEQQAKLLARWEFQEMNNWNETIHPKTKTVILKFDDFIKLPLAIKAFLVAWLEESFDFRTCKLAAHQLDTIKIFPTPEMKAEYLKVLHEYKLIDQYEYLLYEIEFTEELAYEMKHGNYFLNPSSESVFELWWDIAYHEILEYYKHLMKESNFTVNYNPKTKDLINHLVKTHSINDSFNVIWRAVHDGCSFLAKNNGDFEYASNTVPINIKRRSDMLLENKLKPLEFKRISACKQSSISKFFCEKVTELGDSYFSMGPPMKVTNQ